MEEKYFKQKLNKEEYKILREKGTEVPFTGKYLKETSKGTYVCLACGNKLFLSDAKFDSGTGWPSFDEALPNSVNLIEDNSLGMNRFEVVCANCGSHLGHIFDDGPTKTGKRYCINSVCLDLNKKQS